MILFALLFPVITYSIEVTPHLGMAGAPIGMGVYLSGLHEIDGHAAELRNYAPEITAEPSGSIHEGYGSFEPGHRSGIDGHMPEMGGQIPTVGGHIPGVGEYHHDMTTEPSELSMHEVPGSFSPGHRPEIGGYVPEMVAHTHGSGEVLPGVEGHPLATAALPPEYLQALLRENHAFGPDDLAGHNHEINGQVPEVSDHRPTMTGMFTETGGHVPEASAHWPQEITNPKDNHYR